MAFVKLDCGLLDSTLWIDRDARELFITALLMAEPRELNEPEPQIEVRSLEQTGYEVPEGWYGFVAAAGTGIVRRAGMSQEAGMAALERLCAPESESRTPDHDGRRLARINGGYIVLNFDKYRQKDHTGAERQKRFRERQKSNGVTGDSNGVTERHITQAEAEAQAEKEIPASLDSIEFTAAWLAWKQYRKEKRQKLTKSTIEFQFRKLEPFGPAIAAATIYRSIEQGWAGLFPEKINSNGQTKNHQRTPPSRNVGHNQGLDYSNRPRRKNPPEV